VDPLTMASLPFKSIFMLGGFKAQVQRVVVGQMGCHEGR